MDDEQNEETIIEMIKEFNRKMLQLHPNEADDSP